MEPPSLFPALLVYMKRLGVLMHLSLDGLIAGPDGEIDWIKVDEELFDYVGTIVSQADTAIYGRVTYQMMEAYWPTAADNPKATKHDIEHSAWYKQVSKVVVSRTLISESRTNTRIIGENIAEEVRALKQTNGGTILILGSPSVVHALTEEHMIDDYWLNINPQILGHGIPLFADLVNPVSLNLKSTKVFSSGVIGLHYSKI
jgi:dihydrofolate reductase